MIISKDLERAISNAVSPTDVNLQQQALQIISRYRNNQLKQLVEASLHILLTHSQLSYRKFCAHQLQISLFDSQSISNFKFMDTLTLSDQENIFLSLVQTLRKELDAQVIKIISDLLQKTSVLMLPDRNIIFSMFDYSLQKLLIDQRNENNTILLMIFAKMIKSCPTYFKRMDNMTICLFIEYILKHPNQEVNISALLCFSSLFQVMSDHEYNFFKVLASSVAKAAICIIAQQNNQDIVQIFLTMIEIRPKFFYEKTQDFIIAEITDIFSLINLSAKNRLRIIAAIIQYICDNQTIFDEIQEEQKWANTIIDMIFFSMVNISANISNEWIQAERQYNITEDEDEDSQITSFCMKQIDNLLKNINQDIFFPILLQFTEKWLQLSDWRCIYSALMALSQIEDNILIERAMKTALRFINYDNSKVRYAVCHAIGLMSNYMSSSLKDTYGQTYISHLISIILNDPAPIVVSHSLNALTNFLEEINYEVVFDLIDPLMNIILHFAEKGIYTLKINSLYTISSLVQTCKDRFNPYNELILQIIFAYFQNQTKYGKLQLQSIRTITFIFRNVNPDNFRPYIDRFVHILIDFKQQLHQRYDQDILIIFMAWDSLLFVYKEELNMHLQARSKELFEFIKRILKEQTTFFKENEKIHNSVQEENNLKRIQANEDKIIEILQSFIKHCSDFFKPYALETADMLIKIHKSNSRQINQQRVIQTLAQLIDSSEDNIFLISFARHLLEGVLDHSENELKILKFRLKALKQIVEKLDNCFLSQIQVSRLLEQSIKSVLIERNRPEEEQFLQTLHFIYSTLIQVVFRTHEAVIVQLMPSLTKQILLYFSVNEQNEIGVFMHLTLMNNIILNFSYQSLYEFYQYSSSILQGYITNRSNHLRQLGSYGLGILAERTPSHKLNPQKVIIWLTCLKDSLEIPIRNNVIADYQKSKDSAVSAIGNIIKTHFNLFSPTIYLQLWMQRLPLRYDLIQGIVQHEIFIDFMLDKPELILGNDKLRNLEKVMIIIGEIVENEEFYNKQIMLKINHYFQKVKACEEDYKTALRIWRGLQVNRKKNLSKYII